MNQLTQRSENTLSISLYDYWASARLIETCPRCRAPQTPYSPAGNNSDMQLCFSPSPPKCFQKLTEKEKSILKSEKPSEVSEMLTSIKFSPNIDLVNFHSFQATFTNFEQLKFCLFVFTLPGNELKMQTQHLRKVFFLEKEGKIEEGKVKGDLRRGGFKKQNNFFSKRNSKHKTSIQKD